MALTNLNYGSSVCSYTSISLNFNASFLYGYGGLKSSVKAAISALVHAYPILEYNLLFLL